jgi:chorismate synthase
MVLIMAVPAYAGQAIGKTADAAITTGQGYLKSIIMHTDGTNSCTFAVYDNTAASGTKIFSTLTVTTSAANRATTIEFQPDEAKFFTGIYVDITTSGTITYDVYFENK